MMSRFRQFSHGQVFSVVAILALVIAAGLTVSVSQQKQEQRSRASVASLVSNGSFENTGSSWLNPWWFYKENGASGYVAQDSSTKVDGSYSAKTTVTGITSNEYEVGFGQSFSFSQGKSYAVSFWAKSDVSRKIQFVIEKGYSPYSAYKEQEFDVTSDWKEYSLLFTPSVSESNAVMVFHLGQAKGNVWFDNVFLGDNYVSPVVTTTPIPTPTVAYFPTATPIVVATSTPYPPTSTPTYVLTNTPVPITLTPYPTVSPIYGHTYVALDLLLHGVGKGGDTVNPTGEGNMNPVHPQRGVNVQVLNAQNEVVVSTQGIVTYDVSSGSFKGLVDLGDSLQTGVYLVKVKGDQYLRSQIGGIQNLTAGQSNMLLQDFLVTGDINGDNQLNILDYNILMGCYSDLLPAVSCSGGDKVLADLTDDGGVNQFDYNLFLRELLNKSGQ